MKIRFKVIIPVIILVVASLSILSTIILVRTSNLFYNNLVSNLNNNLTSVKNIVLNQEEAIKTTTTTISKTAIPLANSIARIIHDNPGTLSESGLKNLASNLNVEEICVINDKGIITHSNIPEYINFDFHKSDQTKPFLDILNGKVDTLAQEPMKKGVDGKLFQFVGVKGIGGGIVQVGFSPEAIISIQETLNINNLLSNMKLGEDGIAFTLSKEGIVKFHPDKNIIGKKITELNEGNELIKGNSGYMKHKANDKDMIYSYEKLNDSTYLVIDQSLDSLASFNSSLRGITIFLAIIVIILISSVVYLVITKVAIKPINNMLNGIKSLEEGDLTIEISNNSNDEVGILSKSLNITVSKIRELVNSIKELSDQLVNDNNEIKKHATVVSSSSEEISGAIGEIATGSTIQANGTTDTLELTNILNEKIKVGTTELEEVIQNVEEMNKQSILGKDSLSNLNNRLIDSTSVSDEVYGNISELLNMSNSIGNIVDTIKAIADQTNLLALNAAIEAARAGEHGRGFSVVAGQVSELAEESDKSSTEIQNIINDIICLINTTTKSVEDSKNAMNDAKLSAENTNTVFKGLDGSINKVMKSVELLDNNMSEISMSKDKVLSSIENIASIAHENAACAEEVASSTEEQTNSITRTSELVEKLSNMNENLSKLINRFKV